MPLLGTRTLRAAWTITRKRLGLWAITAVALAIALAVVGELLYRHEDAHSIISQIVLSAAIFVSAYLVFLTVAAGRLEGDRDSWRDNFDVLQRRCGISSILGDVARDIRIELDKPDPMTAEHTAQLVTYYANRALSALRSDRYPGAERIRALEAIRDDDSADPRARLEQLEELLRQNVLTGLYLRPG